MRLTDSHSKWVISFFTLPFSPCSSIIKLHPAQCIMTWGSRINERRGWMTFLKFSIMHSFHICVHFCLLLRVNYLTENLLLYTTLFWKKRITSLPKIMIIWGTYHTCSHIQIIHSFIQFGCWLCSKYIVHLQKC